jgi:hypothetical protein
VVRVGHQEPARQGRSRAERQSWQAKRRRVEALRLQDHPPRSGRGRERRYRIIGEEIEPAEAEAIKEAAARVLRGESIRSIAFDFNDRGIK